MASFGIDDAMAIPSNIATCLDCSLFCLVDGIAFAAVIAGKYNGKFAAIGENYFAIKVLACDVVDAAGAGHFLWDDIGGFHRFLTGFVDLTSQ